MKSRFETENAVDFSTLDPDERLAVARKFANIAPLIIQEALIHGRMHQDASQALASRLSAATTQKSAIAICNDYASDANELNDAFTAVIKEVAFVLGFELRGLGLRFDNAAPTTTTRN